MQIRAKRRNARKLSGISVSAGSVLAMAVLFGTSAAQAQTLSKVDRLLQQYGYQLGANSYPGGTFFFNGHDVGGNFVPGFTQANYTTAGWNYDDPWPAPGNSQVLIPFTDNAGVAITAPWSMWLKVPANSGDHSISDQISVYSSHLSNLVSASVGDEGYWESDSTVSANYVAAFQAAQADPRLDNTILYTNEFIGQSQLDAGGVSNFIQQAHPDMMSFDWYPFTNGNIGATDDSQIMNTPFDSWYTEMRFYRDVTLDNSYQPSDPNYSVAFGIYRQVYSTDDGTRRPSATEYAMETFTAMAFNAKQQMDFVYNGSASQLFTDTNQSGTTPFYYTVQHVNQEAQNLGRSMVYLTPMDANPDPNWATGTPDILFLRGQQVSGNTTTPNTLPNGFQPNGGKANAGYSSWISGYKVAQSWTTSANDPWTTGFGQANIGGTVGQYTNAAGKPAAATGDVLVSWFRPLGLTKQQVMDPTSPDYGNIYFMIVNAFSTPTANPGDCLQNIHLDFSDWPMAAGETIPSIQYIDPTTGQVVTVYEDQTGMMVTNATIEPAGTVLLSNTAGDPTNHTGKLRLNVYLNGGEGFLFKFNNGSAFLVPEPASASALLGLGALGLLSRRRRNKSN